jgi:hypothetical protein
MTGPRRPYEDGEFLPGKGRTTRTLASERTHRIARVRYTHDAMIDAIIAEPAVRQKDLAEKFGISPTGVSAILNSDAFLARLEERKKEIVDPSLVATAEERLKGVLSQSLEILAEKLRPENQPTSKLALDVARLASTALGYGARGPSVEINNSQSFVVALPQPATSEESWEAKHRIIEHERS